MRSKYCERVLLEFFDLCGGREQCLVSMDKMESIVVNKLRMQRGDISPILRALESDDYIDIIYTDRHGEPFILVNLKRKAKNFKRERAEKKRDVLFKFALAAMSAVITFVIGRVLYALFN